jgi:hypothetical protein
MTSSTANLTTYHRYLDTLPLASRQPTVGSDDVQLPVPLLAQLARPITSLGDVDSLVLELKDARARGCF